MRKKEKYKLYAGLLFSLFILETKEQKNGEINYIDLVLSE